MGGTLEGMAASYAWRYDDMGISSTGYQEQRKELEHCLMAERTISYDNGSIDTDRRTIRPAEQVM